MDGYDRNASFATRKRGRDDWGYQEGHKHVRYGTTEIQLDRVKKYLLTLGDPTLIADFEDETLHNGILSMFRDHIIELPMKIPFLATAISLASTKEASIGKHTVEFMATAVQAFLDNGEWRKFKLVLRFLAYSISIIDGDGVLDILDVLTQRICDISRDMSERGDFNTKFHADELAYVFLITVPYVIARSTEASHNFDTLFSYVDRIEPYMRYRSVDLSLLQLFIEDDPSNGIEILEELWNQIQYMKNGNYDASILLRPWLRFEMQLENTPKFTLPPIVLPKTFDNSGRFYFPESHFRIFNQTDQLNVSYQTMASSIIRDLLGDIIDIMEFNRKEAARFLADLPFYFSPNVFIYEAISSEATDIMSTLTEWKYEEVILETIFRRLFRLPKPLQPLIYYHSLLIELCKLIPQTIAPSLGYLIRYIYQALPRLDPEISFRFWTWFSHHLSNFNFSWKWDEWVYDLDLDSMHPKKAFIRETIEKEISLSYCSKIKDSLPEAYHLLLPENPFSSSYFDYELPNSKYYAEVGTLLETMRVNTEQSETDVALEIIEKTAIENNESDPPYEALKALVQCVLHLGEKSYSSSLNTIERNLPGLQARCNANDRTRRQTVDIIIKFWRDKPAIGTTLVNKFLNYSVIDAVSIIEWVILDADIEYISRNFTWELIKMALNKVNSTPVQIKDRINTETSYNEPGSLSDYRKAYDEVYMKREAVFVTIFEKFPKLFDRAKASQNKRNGIEKNETLNNQKGWQLWWAEGLFKEIARRYYYEISNLSDSLNPVINNKYIKEIFEKVRNLNKII
ncbi:hypothetical protein MERGE_002799 [Pneumocystis wakefieldiae]|uniref:MIF4G domain-containing protein n=1 Tax=Pneumocystis wakefieldiae TaxID=38082 RepID=A0A899GA81_9ASCO|nr:hypothetical protein MERGE_002799 [Pneumocystis wakefieldiae]